MDNTADICRETLAALQPYSGGDSPEFLAYSKALEDSYQGKGVTEASVQAEARYWAGIARDLRPFADRATNPDLRKALRAQVEAAQRRAEGDGAQPGDSDAVIRVSKICAEHPDR